MTRSFLLYPGCTVLGRFPEYEAASERILKTIGVEIRTVQEFCCCGASYGPGVWEDWIHLPAYTLAQAEQDGFDLLTLCGGCTNTFRRAAVYLKSDPALLGKVNHTLAKFGLSYSGVVRIRHLIDVLEANLDVLSKVVVRSLGQKVALSPPCQVFKPSRLGEGRGLDPGGMRRVVEGIGIQIVAYPREEDCCGATLLTADESMALRTGESKLRSATDFGADVVCVACGNCLFLFDRYQTKMGTDKRLPIVTLAELVERAMGRKP